MNDSVEVNIEDIVKEMDPQTKMGWELAHTKAINKILIRKLADAENRANGGPE